METPDVHRINLEKLLEKVTTELTSFAIQNEESGDWEVRGDLLEQPEADENSEADAAESLAEQTATLVELETSYRNISRALEKINTGTFGTCEICGTEIAPARLLILPSARTCTEHLDDERTLPL